jgi:hypothetical protein
LKTIANTNETRKGLLVLVTEYRNIATATGRRNHKFKGANAPDKTIPLRMATGKLTI